MRAVGKSNTSATPRGASHLTVVAAGIVRRCFSLDRYRDAEVRNCVLVTRRPKGRHLAGLWEFPGGKVERAEDPRDTVAREIREECGIDVNVGDVFEVTFHSYPEKDVLLLFFVCDWIEGEVQDLETAGHRWLTLEELSSSDMPAGDVPVLGKLWAKADSFFL